MTPREPSNAELSALESDPAFDSILEDLYTEAQLAQRPARRRRGDNPALARHLPSASLHELFVNPENWERKGAIVLMHDDTQSALGCFSVYLHKSVPGCRKLLRETSPIGVSGIEHVAGDWWLGLDRKVEAARPWHETRSALVKLHLSELGVFAPLVEVAARLEHGGIARVELAAETLFADSDGLQLLTLPKGTNVLPVMSFDCKITLRQELGL